MSSPVAISDSLHQPTHLPPTLSESDEVVNKAQIPYSQESTEREHQADV